MTDIRREAPVFPSDVLPPTDDERIARADALKQELRRAAFADGHQAIVVGQLLHDMSRQRLWTYYAETWQEFINDIGMTQATEYMKRRNYEFYILELEMDATDPRLAETPPSKLAVGTRKHFRQWVFDNLNEFLDLARLPLGEGGLTRSDLYRYIEEQIGLADDDPNSLTRRALFTLRRAAVQISSLADDARDVLAQAVRDDDDIYQTISNMMEHARAKVPVFVAEEVDVDLEEGW